MTEKRRGFFYQWICVFSQMELDFVRRSVELKAIEVVYEYLVLIPFHHHWYLSMEVVLLLSKSSLDLLQSVFSFVMIDEQMELSVSLVLNLSVLIAKIISQSIDFLSFQLLLDLFATELNLISNRDFSLIVDLQVVMIVVCPNCSVVLFQLWESEVLIELNSFVDWILLK